MQYPTLAQRQSDRLLDRLDAGSTPARGTTGIVQWQNGRLFFRLDAGSTPAAGAKRIG